MTLRNLSDDELYALITKEAERRDQDEIDLYHAVGAILKVVLEIRGKLNDLTSTH